MLGAWDLGLRIPVRKELETESLHNSVDGSYYVHAIERLNYRGLKPAGSSGPPTTGTNPYAPTDSVILTQFLSNLKDGASLLN